MPLLPFLILKSYLLQAFPSVQWFDAQLCSFKCRPWTCNFTWSACKLYEPPHVNMATAAQTNEWHECRVQEEFQQLKAEVKASGKRKDVTAARLHWSTAIDLPQIQQSCSAFASSPHMQCTVHRFARHFCYTNAVSNSSIRSNMLQWKKNMTCLVLASWFSTQAKPSYVCYMQENIEKCFTNFAVCWKHFCSIIFFCMAFLEVWLFMLGQSSL